MSAAPRSALIASDFILSSNPMPNPFKKLLASFGKGVAATATSVAAPAYAPYANAGVDAIYNLLFCDDAQAYASRPGQEPAAWQSTLFATPPDVPALERLAADAQAEGRVRYLAYRRLRELGRSVPAKVLLGVIVEVPLRTGLDTLAAFSDGGIRYINQSGKMSVVDGVSPLDPIVRRLFDAARPVVQQIGPWDQPRLAPPTAGNARLTFLVSDGLYFGQGPMNVLQADAKGSPVLREAGALLSAVVDLSLKK